MKRILVVEDDRSMMEALALILKFEGYEVLTALNGQLAIQLIDEQSMPDLILLDMVMPEMNGWEFAEEYEKKYKQRAPVIVCTGAADPAQRAVDVHAVGYIEKPYEIDTLLSLVRSNIL